MRQINLSKLYKITDLLRSFILKTEENNSQKANNFAASYALVRLAADETLSLFL